MKFTLVYHGELKANQREALDGQKDKLAKHKHAIRREFHLQLKYLWETNAFLKDADASPESHHLPHDVFKDDPVWTPSDSNRFPLQAIIAAKHREFGYRFVPLVRKEWKLQCELRILFLRRNPPGSLVQAGDLDNRMKTLIDALRMPKSANELLENESPLNGEDPFYCLLEDDDLITRIDIDSDRLLIPPKVKNDSEHKNVQLVISVEVRPYFVSWNSIGFL